MGANAQIAVPAFTAGQVLTAAQQTEINTGIPVFATTVTRDAAFGGANEKVLAEGQFAYIEATNTTQYYDGASWLAVAGAKLGQVVNTVKTDTFSSSSTSYVDITGLSLSITPTSASSTILIFAVVNGAGVSGVADATVQLLRNSTAIGNGATAGSRSVGFGQLGASSSNMFPGAITFLDSPATTSATTYKIQAKLQTGVGTFNINRGATDTDNAGFARVSSQITAIEVLP
jgi:hypothetical protein